MKPKKFSRKGSNKGTRGFSRKDREQLEEFGSLGHPGDDTEPSEHHSVAGSIDLKVRKVIDETFDEARRNRKNKKFKTGRGGADDAKPSAVPGVKEGEEEGEEEDEDWERPSSYTLLVSSLRAKSHKKASTLPRKLVENGSRKTGAEDAGLKRKARAKARAQDVGQDPALEGMDDHVFTKLDRMATSTERDDSSDDGGDGNDDGQDAREDRRHNQAQKKTSERGKLKQDPADPQAENAEDEAEELTEAEKREAEEHDEFSIHFGDEFSGDIKDSMALFREGGEKWQSRSFADSQVGTVTVFDVLDVEEADLEPTANQTLDDFFVKKKLHSEWLSLNAKKPSKKAHSAAITEENPLTELQRKILGFANRYKDFLFPQRTQQNAAEIRNLYCLHSMNHVLKTRDKVLKNTIKLNAVQQQQKGDENQEEERDQGFTRPKVLILVPFRDAAFQVINTIIDLCSSQQKSTVENRKRFKDEFSEEEEEEDNPFKPADWKETFHGNIDDCFRIGLKFTRKSVKLFADFYSADILVASPLGLRIIIGAEGERNRDFDFLSSIEMLIIDQADIIQMQNWDHLLHVIDNTNLQPKTNRGTDILRIRNWTLEGLGKNVRQTLLFSGYLFPELNALFNRLQNYSGKVKMTAPITNGTISKVVLQVPQIFHRISCKSPADMNDAKFLYFKEKVLPELRDSLTSKHTCIFFSSYFEYIRVRNYLRDLEVDFANICEYSTNSSVTRARTAFFHGHQGLMLMTERFYFFRRPRMRAIHHLVFYGLPENAQFYPELLNLLQGDPITCAGLFSKYDRFKLERIVGSERCSRMISSDQPTFMFV